MKVCNFSVNFLKEKFLGNNPQTSMLARDYGVLNISTAWRPSLMFVSRSDRPISTVSSL